MKSFISRALSLPGNKSFFLFGPRQTGKSTLIKELFAPGTSLFYDLLNSETYRRLAARPELIRAEVQAAVSRKQVSHVIIDEVQKIPQLLDEVHYLIESGLSCLFVLSGSSARKLKRAQANMLAGRAWTFHLHPFSFHEITDRFDLDRALRFGMLPSITLADDDHERSEILRSYVDTYVKEEVELEAQLRNVGGFLRFLPIVASENGETLNYSNIARETAVAGTTVKAYFQILEDTLLGFYLLPYGKSIRKKMVRHPKFYFFDTGVVRALTRKLSVPLIEGSSEYGRVFEHFLLCEIMKINETRRLDLGLSFYRTERGAEVDCIIESPAGRTIALEIKSTSSPTSAHCRGLRSFKQCVPKAELYLACRAPRALQIGHVTILPWCEMLDLLLQID